MLRIGDIIFSPDILEKKFRCDLPRCLGNCCRYGDAGAPLSDAEVVILQEIWHSVKPYLRKDGIDVVEREGTSVRDFENENVTPLIGEKECAYATLDNLIYKCGIEQAWSEGKTDFRKPLSCHLFPARVKKFSGFSAVNYQELSICSSALESGRREGVYVYEFLKTAFIRAFGEEVYEELRNAAGELRKPSSRPSPTGGRS